MIPTTHSASSPILPRSCRIALTAVTLTLCMMSASATFAQSNGGLKLGQPSEQTQPETLDLGATPPADREPEAVPPSVSPADLAPSGNSGPVGQVSTTKVGAWDVACPPEGVNCAMAQVGEDASGTPVLEMVIRKLDEPLEVGETTAIAVLDVITPLGVVLIEGLSVSIDGGRAESAPFKICTEQGCLVREPIDDDLVSRFKRGNSAEISVIAANQGEVKATLSLSGFTKAYTELK